MTDHYDVRVLLKSAIEWTDVHDRYEPPAVPTYSIEIDVERSGVKTKLTIPNAQNVVAIKHWSGGAPGLDAETWVYVKTDNNFGDGQAFSDPDGALYDKLTRSGV